MSIRFYCPNCDTLIAFHEKHAGKRARCLNCGQLFVIPQQDDQVPEKIELQQIPEALEPLPGFYRAASIETLKIFFRLENLTSLVFVAALVCFKFFLAKPLCCSILTDIFAWGWLLGFYLNIINETAFGVDALPQIYLGTSLNFLWHVLKPFFVFLYSAFIALLPFFFAASALRNKGVTFENFLQPGLGHHSIMQAFFILGLFLFPAVILTTAVGKDLTLLRPDYLLAPVFKAPLPYLLAVAILAAAVFFQFKTSQFKFDHWSKTAADLAMNLAAQIPAIAAMRAIGLFYRHHTCHIKW